MAVPPVTNKERARMREMRLRKMSLERIAAEMGRTGRCVHEHVADIDVRCRPGKRGMGQEAYARLEAASEAGADKYEIAARFGIKHASVAPTLSRFRKLRGRASA